MILLTFVYFMILLTAVYNDLLTSVYNRIQFIITPN